MATYNKINQFIEDVFNGVHNMGTHAIKVYLSNAAPSATLDAIKTDLAEIATGNGYTGPQTVTVNSSTETTGTYTCAVTTDITITAAGGTVGPFQYVVLMNDTPTSPVDPLIGWWDYGSAITLADGEDLVIDFTASIFTAA